MTEPVAPEPDGPAPDEGDWPLGDVRVLDLSRVLSGPSCAKALADLGADVIKIEPPEGDLTRTAQPRTGGIPVYFAQQNSGKRCLSVDLRTPRGRDVVLRLVQASDVVVENFRPGVLDRLGLGYEQARALRPAIIYCSVTGYGQDGPSANRRAYAPVMHAELGLMELTARRRRSAPVAEAISHADLYAGLQATIAILAALRHRDRTGEGQHVDVSMAEALLQAMELTAVELAGGEGDRFHVFGGYNAPVLRLGDGTVVCVAGDPVSTFPAWCKAMGGEALLADERFSTHQRRDANRAAMLGELQSFAERFRSFEDFEAVIGRSGMAAGAVRTVTEAATSNWAAARGVVVDVGDASSGPLELPRSAFRFSAARAGTHGRPAHQGQHNREVLMDVLGMTEDDVTSLSEAGVLHERGSPGAAQTTRAERHD
jgi:crotonobetainyl-CoA:carnitine CoA-transferase CaiB-like acyl-CoA transferase